MVIRQSVHGAFVSDDEVHAVASDWKARGRPQYIEAITKCGEEGESGNGGGYDDGEELDPLFDQAVEFVVENNVFLFLVYNVNLELAITVPQEL